MTLMNQISLSLYERYRSLFTEMAYAGQVGDMEIQVYSDHEPFHFHVSSRKRGFEARVIIPTHQVQSEDDLFVISYKRKKKNELTRSDMRDIADWLQQSNRKGYLNYDRIVELWDALNPDKKIPDNE